MAKEKTHRKEAVSFRIEPKIKYMIEVASRVQRRNISNYVEFTLEDSLRKVAIDEDKNVYDVITDLWSPNELQRIINLWDKYPNLLTFEEEQIIEIIKIYLAVPNSGNPIKELGINAELIRDWDIIKGAATGDAMFRDWINEKQKRLETRKIDLFKAPLASEEEILKFIDAIAKNIKFTELTDEKIKETLKAHLHIFIKDKNQEIGKDNIELTQLRECWGVIVEASYWPHKSRSFLLNKDSMNSYISQRNRSIANQ